MVLVSSSQFLITNCLLQAGNWEQQTADWKLVNQKYNPRKTEMSSLRERRKVFSDRWKELTESGKLADKNS